MNLKNSIEKLSLLGIFSAVILIGCVGKNSTAGNVFGYSYDPSRAGGDAAAPIRPVTQTNKKAHTPSPSPSPSPFVEPSVKVVAIMPQDMPTAELVAEKPGFVRSPYAPQAGLIDIRGYPVGVELKDPYTGKIFLVPPPSSN